LSTIESLLIRLVANSFLLLSYTTFIFFWNNFYFSQKMDFDFFCVFFLNILEISPLKMFLQIIRLFSLKHLMYCTLIVLFFVIFLHFLSFSFFNCFCVVFDTSAVLLIQLYYWSYCDICYYVIQYSGYYFTISLTMLLLLFLYSGASLLYLWQPIITVKK
jgi:hypothetical protein